MNRTVIVAACRACTTLKFFVLFLISAVLSRGGVKGEHVAVFWRFGTLDGEV